MASEMEVEIVNQLKGMANELRLVRGESNALKATQRDMVGEMMKGFQAAGVIIPEAKHHVEGFKHEIVEAGHALRGMGGPLAQIAHHLTGGFRFEGGLMGVAVAAGAAGVALEIFNKISETNEEQINSTTEAVHRYENALYEAEKKAKGAKLGIAEGDMDQLSQGEARGGESFKARAGYLSDDGVTSEKDAQSAASESYLIDEKVQVRAIQVAKLIAMTKEMSATAAIDIMKDPRNSAMLYSKGLSNEDLASNFILDKQKRNPSAANLESVKAEIERSKEPAKGSVLGGTRDITDELNKGVRAGNATITTGEAAEEAKRKTGEITDPKIEVDKAHIRAVNENSDKLAELAKGQYALTAVMQDLAHAARMGQGSAETRQTKFLDDERKASGRPTFKETPLPSKRPLNPIVPLENDGFGAGG